jgi:alcohol dehydrogenase (cytochrome c)
MTARTLRRALLLGLILVASLHTLNAQVTFDRILRAKQEPQNWLTYSGGVYSQRHSELTQITPENVKNLELSWMYQLQSREPTNTRFEVTPLVVDGVMYFVQPPNDVIAVDAATGRQFWMYSYNPSPQSRPCCGRVNRGVAILGDRLFMGTIDGHLISLDAKTGKLVWDVAVVRPEQGYAFDRARRRRVRHPRIHGSLRRGDREGSLALPHDSGTGRAWIRELDRRCVENRRWLGVGDRIV